jgi:hypothetical protein
LEPYTSDPNDDAAISAGLITALVETHGDAS